jgi:hypothetical protein
LIYSTPGLVTERACVKVLLLKPVGRSVPGSVVYVSPRQAKLLVLLRKARHYAELATDVQPMAEVVEESAPEVDAAAVDHVSDTMLESAPKKRGRKSKAAAE